MAPHLFLLKNGGENICGAIYQSFSLFWIRWSGRILWGRQAHVQETDAKIIQFLGEKNSIGHTRVAHLGKCRFWYKSRLPPTLSFQFSCFHLLPFSFLFYHLWGWLLFAFLAWVSLHSLPFSLFFKCYKLVAFLPIDFNSSNASDQSSKVIALHLNN